MFFNHAHIIPKVIKPDNSGIKDLLKISEELDLEGVVCFSPFSYQVDSLGLNPNKWLYEEIKNNESLIGFGTINPNLSVIDQVKEISDFGFKGVKLHPAAQKFSVFGDWANEVYTELVKYNLIADFHTGIHWHRIKEYSPILFDEVAFKYPDLKMIFEHVGGWHYFKEMVAVIANHQRDGNHLYGGIASVLDKVNQRFWYLGVEGLKDLKWQIGGDLLIFGMDFPYNKTEQIKRDIKIINENFSIEVAQAILGGNLKRLLGLTDGTAEIVGGDPK